MTVTTDQPIRVIAADDHPMLLEGIASVIARHPDIALVGEASNGREALELYRKLRPDVVLMDIQMADMNGVDAITQIRAENPSARCIVLTMYKGDALAMRALKAGAVGYLLKSALRKTLVDSIRTVHGGGRAIYPDVAVALAEHATLSELTEKELEVLAHLVRGAPNKVIAARLGISEETVKVHMKHILAKLGANDRTHAVAIAIHRGIIEV